MSEPFTAIRADPVFEVASAAQLVLDTDLRIQAVNGAYEEIAGHSRDELVGQYLFEMFPDNPDDPADDGAPNLTDSLERVLRYGRRHTMGLQRYDVLEPGPDGVAEFVRKFWSPVNSPLMGQGRVVGVLHEVEDATALFAPQDTGPPTACGVRPRAWTATTRRLRQANADLMAENRHLRAALTARAVIDQAKGLLMARHGCGPDEAFTLLVTLSQQSNTKLRDVAAALVAGNGSTDRG